MDFCGLTGTTISGSTLQANAQDYDAWFYVHRIMDAHMQHSDHTHDVHGCLMAINHSIHLVNINITSISHIISHRFFTTTRQQSKCDNLGA